VKLRTGEPTEKEKIMDIAKKGLEKVRSIQEFIEQIKMEGYDVYTRNGNPYGIIGTRKYRFTSLGLSLEKFEREIDKSISVQKDINIKTINR
jgi:hypothetical protein